MPFGTNDEVIFGADDEEVSQDQLSRGQFLESAKGLGETAASLVAGIPAQIAGGLYGLGTVLSGQGIDTAGHTVEEFQRKNFGFGEYRPTTQSGKRGAELVQKVMSYPGQKAGDLGETVGEVLGDPNLGRLTAQLPVDTLMNFLPIGVGAKGTQAVIKRAGKPSETISKEGIGERLDKLPEQTEMFGKGDEVLDPIPQNELLPSRAPQYGVSDTILGDHWVLDENGVPIRADLSIEAQQLGEPLQRNLWGDELPPKSPQEGIPLTEAIDSMPDLPWRSERDAGLEMLRDEVMASDDLIKAVNESLRNKPMGFKQGQRGAGDLKGIGEELSKLVKPVERFVNDMSKIDISKVVPKDKQDYAAEIPGMKGLVEGIIPRPELDIESALRSSKDIPDIWQKIASGPEMVGEKYRNPIVAGTSKYLQWADKKYEYANKKLIQPLERMVANLPQKAMIDLSDVMKKEMFRRERFTPEQLREAGMTEKQMESYNKLREELDTVYAMQVKILEKQGRKVPTRQEAHLASLRNGNYHVNVKDEKGNLAWYTQARSKYDAQKAVNWLKKQKGIGNNIKIEYRNPNVVPGIPRDMLGGFQEILKLVDGNSDASLALQQAIREATEQAGYQSRGQSNRFLEKANIRGFEGDMPWLSPAENAKRLLQSQVDYLNNSYKWSYLNDALGDVKNILADERVLAEQPNAAAYVKEVVKSQLGLSEHFTRGAEEAVMHGLGLSRSQLGSTSKSVGKWTSLLQLGGNVGYMIATPLTSLYSVGLHLREGTLGVKAISKSIGDSSAGIFNFLMDEQGGKARLPMTELGKAALKYAEDNGVITKNMFDDIDAINRNRSLGAVETPLRVTTMVPEQIQRISTFMSFVHGLKEQGGFKNMYDLFQRAETLTNLAATNFRPSEQPIAVQQAGVLGSAAFKYKAPIANYYHQLHMAAIDAAKGNPKMLIGLLGMTAYLGGVQNLPGVETTHQAWNWMKDAVAKFSPENYDKVKDMDVKNFIRQNAGEAAAFGAVQAATGAQMSQRFGTDLVNLEDPLKNMFPAASMLGNVAGAGEALLSGDPTQAAWNLSPQIGRGNLETNVDRFRGLQPGSFRKPSDISNTDIQQIRTPGDETYRKVGLRSAEEAKRLESSAMVNKEQKRINVALEANMKKLMDNLVKGDTADVEKYASAWLRLNPDSNAFNSALTSKIQAASLSPEQRELMRMRGVMAAEKYLRLQNARN